MDVNARNCDTGEDESVEHVKYDSDRMEIMYVILTQIECEVIGRSGREWMVLFGETSS